MKKILLILVMDCMVVGAMAQQWSGSSTTSGTIKQEYVYRYPTSDVTELHDGIGRYIRFYNEERPHQSLGNLVLPSKKYFQNVA